MTKSDRFESIIVLYQDLVYSICYKMLGDSFEAENIAQDSYLNLYKSFDKYISFEDNHIKNLLCKIALNKCKDVLKSSRYKKTIVADITEGYEHLCNQDEDIEEKIFLQERKTLISKMINELKDPYKSIIQEYYINEKSIDEISEILKIPKPTIKVQIYRAKKILKQNISSKGGDVFEIRK